MLEGQFDHPDVKVTRPASRHPSLPFPPRSLRREVIPLSLCSVSSLGSMSRMLRTESNILRGRDMTLLHLPTGEWRPPWRRTEFHLLLLPRDFLSFPLSLSLSPLRIFRNVTFRCTSDRVWHVKGAIWLHSASTCSRAPREFRPPSLRLSPPADCN